MPELALTLCAAWLLLLVVVRSILQWRSTGSTGIKGFRGRLGSLEWFAGLTASIGLMLVPIAPIATLQQWPLGALFVHNTTVHLVGGLLVALGILGALAAQITMGDSWRVGVDKRERTALVTAGIYQWVRNPIFSFIGFSLLGYALVIPNVWMLLALGFAFIGIQLQVRFVEEPYLLTLHGETYQRYTASVGRFFPAIGKSRTQTQNPGVAQ